MAKSRVVVFGVVGAMRYLNKYEPQLYKEIKKQMHTSALPLANLVGGDFPESPLTNWDGSHPARRRKAGKPFPLYEASGARGGVRPKIGISRVRSGGRSILRIQQMTAGGAVYDSAGSKSRNIFTENLDTYAPAKGTSRIGKSRSRVMYKAVETRMPMVDSIVKVALELTNDAAQKAINLRGKK